MVTFVTDDSVDVELGDDVDDETIDEFEALWLLLVVVAGVVAKPQTIASNDCPSMGICEPKDVATQTLFVSDV